MLNGGEYQGVGAVDYGGVEAGEVDLGCCFGVVAHAFAYYTYGDAFGFGGGCPAVAGYVECQWDCYAYHLGYFLEVVVDVVAHVAVSAAFVEAGLAYDGEQVVAFVDGIFVEGRLHLAGPFDGELLAGFAAAVCDISVFKVGFFQESHVDETHTPQIETHQEHVAGEIECTAA